MRIRGKDKAIHNNNNNDKEKLTKKRPSRITARIRQQPEVVVVVAAAQDSNNDDPTKEENQINTKRKRTRSMMNNDKRKPSTKSRLPIKQKLKRQFSRQGQNQSLKTTTTTKSSESRPLEDSSKDTEVRDSEKGKSGNKKSQVEEAAKDDGESNDVDVAEGPKQKLNGEVVESNPSNNDKDQKPAQDEGEEGGEEEKVYPADGHTYAKLTPHRKKGVAGDGPALVKERPRFKTSLDENGLLCVERPEGWIGVYSPENRKLRLERFKAKRHKRVWTRRVKYDVRKSFADSRLRVKGRFVKKEDELLMRELISLT